MPREIRVLTTTAEFSHIPALEIEVWGLSPVDVVPANIVRALTLNGGVAHGAFEGSTLIGMALAFNAWRDGKRFLWSHMAAVLPEYQGQGIGFQLKQSQRQWALAHGINEIRWTFDPIQRGNAHFNLHLLGCVSSIYHIDFYGPISDHLIGVETPTDRLEALWKLNDKRVAHLAEGGVPEVFAGSITDDVKLLHRDASGQPVFSGPLGEDAHEDGSERMKRLANKDHDLFVELPPNRQALRALRVEQVLAWRIALRQALTEALEAGFTAVDLVEREGRAYYRLCPPQVWQLYVLACRDGTLYTGIARDLEARVARHNAGTGAAYTAARRPVRLLAAWRFTDHGDALKAEAAFKRQTRTDKLKLIDDKRDFRRAARSF
jgi:predicted GNAT superfamily acetyltransferase